LAHEVFNVPSLRWIPRQFNVARIFDPRFLALALQDIEREKKAQR
jgi:hypothetical protein